MTRTSYTLHTLAKGLKALETLEAAEHSLRDSPYRGLDQPSRGGRVSWRRPGRRSSGSPGGRRDDTAWPESVQQVVERPGLTERAKRKILSENAIRLCPRLRE